MSRVFVAVKRWNNYVKCSTCNTTSIFITTTMGSVGVSLEEVVSRRDHSFLCSSEFDLLRQQRLRERVLKEG